MLDPREYPPTDDFPPLVLGAMKVVTVAALCGITIVLGCSIGIFLARHFTGGFYHGS